MKYRCTCLTRIEYKNTDSSANIGILRRCCSFPLCISISEEASDAVVRVDNEDNARPYDDVVSSEPIYYSQVPIPSPLVLRDPATWPHICILVRYKRHCGHSCGEDHYASRYDAQIPPRQYDSARLLDGKHDIPRYRSREENRGEQGKVQHEALESAGRSVRGWGVVKCYVVAEVEKQLRQRLQHHQPHGGRAQLAKVRIGAECENAGGNGEARRDEYAVPRDAIVSRERHHHDWLLATGENTHCCDLRFPMDWGFECNSDIILTATHKSGPK